VPKDDDVIVAVVPERNVTYGVNYASATTTTTTCSDATTTTTTGTGTGTVSNTTTQIDQQQQSLSQSQQASPTSTTASSTSTIRKSRRRPKPKAAFVSSSFLSPSNHSSSSTSNSNSNSNSATKSRVRYDINLVPIVKKNPQFVQYWRSKNIEDTDTNTTTTTTTNEQHQHQHQHHPFDGDETVVWIPTKRSQWEDSLSELTAVCKSAALRKYQRNQKKDNNNNDNSSNSNKQKPFYAPLSPHYIRDRIDIDDPLIGYQLRHKVGGWLQGFLLLTNFTTWSHYFKWDSTHPASGMVGVQGNGVDSTTATASASNTDVDGSLSSQLEQQHRSGDPLGGGIVFSSIAEISLVGGLACGEYLLRMALEDVAARPQYSHVVLQATESSRPFYEAFGFQRVGAISRYGGKKRIKAGRQAQQQQQQQQHVNNSTSTQQQPPPPKDENDQLLSDLTGYRHWTYAHESTKSLDKHGGPSYMMARRVNRVNRSSSTTNNKSKSFLTTMKQFAVLEKPKVKQLGATATPMVKKNLMTMLASSSSSLSPTSSVPQLPNLQQQLSPSTTTAAAIPSKKGCKRRRSSASLEVVKSSSSSSSSLATVVGKGTTKVSHKKKPRTTTNNSTTSTYQFMQQRDNLLEPPVKGTALSYAQKQYQSVWLAVSPKTETPTRRPPRNRSGGNGGNGGCESTTSTTTTRQGTTTTTTAVAVTTTPTTTTPIQRPTPTTTTIRRRHEDKENVPGASVRKQKSSTIPKRIPKEQHFFNKVVVRLQQQGNNNKNEEDKYFYVLSFDMKHMTLKLVPMARDDDNDDAVVDGKQHPTTKKKDTVVAVARPRWKAQVEEQVLMDDATAAKYKIVASHMLTKTPLVANERWDILQSAAAAALEEEEEEHFSC